MKKRWIALLTQLGKPNSAETLYTALHDLYSEPHRAYHNLQHIADCLTHLHNHHQFSNDPIALELAIWYHDAIYAPFRNDNEEISAKMATRNLTTLNLDAQRITRVENLILITKHNGTPSTADEALMVDIDLATLGSSEAAYATYEAAIREEYKRVPMPIYRRKRKAILRAFLARKTIYMTDPFREQFEKAARINLAWAIEQL